MPNGSNLRIVIACVTFETVKIVEPIRYYEADRVYLLHLGGKEPYDAFIEEVERQLAEMGVHHESIKLNINKFPPVLREVHRIIRREKSLGNHVYVNVGAGPQIFCAGALIACMMEGGIPFNVGTKTFTVSDTSIYYEGGRPVGLTKEIRPPFSLPEFEIKPPEERLVRGLAVWKGIKDQKSHQTAPNIITRLAAEGLMEDIEERPGKVSHGSVMRYRRNFLEPWLKNGWLEKEGRGHSLTERGGIVLEIFGEEGRE